MLHNFPNYFSIFPSKKNTWKSIYILLFRKLMDCDLQFSLGRNQNQLNCKGSLRNRDEDEGWDEGTQETSFNGINRLSNFKSYSNFFVRNGAARIKQMALINLSWRRCLLQFRSISFRFPPPSISVRGRTFVRLSVGWCQFSNLKINWILSFYQSRFEANGIWRGGWMMR